MHTIEFDGASPAPWKITTDDGCEWHASDETRAAAQLLAFIVARELRDLPRPEPEPEHQPALPGGLVMI